MVSNYGKRVLREDFTELSEIFGVDVWIEIWNPKALSTARLEVRDVKKVEQITEGGTVSVDDPDDAGLAIRETLVGLVKAWNMPDGDSAADPAPMLGDPTPENLRSVPRSVKRYLEKQFLEGINPQ